MRSPAPLPEPFRSSPFRVGRALDAGIEPGRLRRSDLVRPFRGVRVAVEADAERAYAPLLRPGERFSHVSAARIWGAPIPDGDASVHVTIPSGTRARSRGVVGHVSAAGRRVLRHGLPVSDPIALFLESAAALPLVDLVAVGDHLVLDPRILDPADPRPYADPAMLRRAAADASSRGVRRARVAAGLVRIGAESPMESRLRLLARDAGVPEPVLQHELRDRRGRIGWFDLAWPERRLIAEYDGDQHRTSRRQYDRDIERFDRAHDLGWRVLRFRAPAVLGRPAEVRRRLADAWTRV